MFKKFAIVAALVLTGAVSHAADISVASGLGNLPFEFNDDKGNLVGFEIDLLNLIGKRLNKSVEYTEMPFNSLFAAVQSGRANIAIGSITITKKRLESVSFSQPYFDAEQCLTVATKGTVKSLEDMGGKQVAVLTGTTGEMWATENQAKYKFAGISRYDGNSEPMLDIATGRIGGFIHDCPNDLYYIKNKPQYKIVASIPTNEQFGLMFPKSSPLLTDVDAVISKLKQEGEIGKLYSKWFGGKALANSSTLNVMPIPKN